MRQLDSRSASSQPGRLRFEQDKVLVLFLFLVPIGVQTQPYCKPDNRTRYQKPKPEPKTRNRNQKSETYVGTTRILLTRATAPSWPRGWPNITEAKPAFSSYNHIYDRAIRHDTAALSTIYTRARWNTKQTANYNRSEGISSDPMKRNAVRSAPSRIRPS